MNGAVLHRGRRDKETKYAELVEGRLRPADVGVTKPSGSSTLWLQLVLVRLLPGCSGPRSWLGGGGGPACWPFLVPGHLPVR